MVPHSRLIWDKARSSHSALQRFCAPAQKQKGFSTFPPMNLMCYGLPYFYNEKDWETVGQFTKRKQLLKPVPTDRLINVKPDQPYLATESGNRFMWSVAMIPFISHSNGFSSKSIFSKGILGVYKPLGVLAVKEFTFEHLELTDDVLRSDYAEAKAYLLSLLEKERGPEVTKVLPRSLKRWLNMMDLQEIDEEDIVFDPSLLPKESSGLLGLDIFTNLRRAMPLLGGKSGKKQAQAILAAIPDESLRNNWPLNVDKNPFLHHWRTYKPGMQWEKKTACGDKVQEEGKGKTGTGEGEQKGKGMEGTSKGKMKAVTGKGEQKGKCMDGTGKGKTETVTGMGEEEDEKGKGKKRRKRRRRKKKKDKVVEMEGKDRSVEAVTKEEEAKKFAKDVALGKGVVDIHRHSYIHVYERIVVKLLKKLNKNQLLSFSKDPYSLWDVLDLLQYEFPEHLQQALSAIKQHSPQLWQQLNIRGRFPLPVSLPPGKATKGSKV